MSAPASASYRIARPCCLVAYSLLACELLLLITVARLLMLLANCCAALLLLVLSCCYYTLLLTMAMACAFVHGRVMVQRAGPI